MGAEVPPKPKGAWIIHIEGGAESQNGFGQIVESTASRPMRYYLAQKTDAGSVPRSATNFSSSQTTLSREGKPCRWKRWISWASSMEKAETTQGLGFFVCDLDCGW